MRFSRSWKRPNIGQGMRLTLIGVATGLLASFALSRVMTQLLFEASATVSTQMKPHLWLITFIGVIVPRRLRADWRQEWEAELRYREAMLAEWEKLDRGAKHALLWHSAGAFMDAVWLQPKRLEDEMFQDLRYGARMLLKSPGFTAAAVLSLALGIGANTAIFSVVNAVMIRPLPYDRPDQIMRLWTTQPERGAVRLPFSAPDFVDLKEQNRVFTDMAVFRGWPFILTGAGEPLSVFGHRVSAGFFTVLGVKPLLGRGFLYEEDSPGNDRVVIISYGLWQSHFAADPGIIGRSLTVNDISRTVVGVMPPGFRFQSQENALWVPMAFTPADLNRRVGNTFVLARLRPGVTRRQAQVEMNTLAADCLRQRRQSATDSRVGAAEGTGRSCCAWGYTVTIDQTVADRERDTVIVGRRAGAALCRHWIAPAHEPYDRPDAAYRRGRHKPYRRGRHKRCCSRFHFPSFHPDRLPLRTPPRVSSLEACE